MSRAAHGDDRIICIFRFVPEKEMQSYLNASDLVVLPFAEVLNSGSVLLALSFNRPVLTAADGALLELRELVGETWIKTYENALTPQHIQDAVKWAAAKRQSSVAPLDKLDWSSIGEQTVEAYRFVLNH